MDDLMTRPLRNGIDVAHFLIDLNNQIKKERAMRQPAITLTSTYYPVEARREGHQAEHFDHIFEFIQWAIRNDYASAIIGLDTPQATIIYWNQYAAIEHFKLIHPSLPE